MQRHLRTIVALAAAAALLLSVPAPAQESLTLEQCIALSLSRHPLRLAADSDILAARARERQARALSQPSLDLDSDLQPRFLDLRGSGESYVGLSQFLEFPGKRANRGRIAGLETQATTADRDLLSLDLTFQVSEAFYTVLLAEENLKYARQNLELAADFREKAELKHAAGDIARVEVVRAGVEEAKAGTAVRSAENDIRLAKAGLNILLGRSRMEDIALRGDLRLPPLSFDPETLFARAVEARPDLARINALQERERLIKKDAGLSFLPDFNLGVARHRITGETTTWDFTLSIPIPLFFWQPLSGPMAEAEANRESLRRQAEQAVNLIRLDVEQAALNARTAESRIRLFESDILSQAEEAYELFAFSFQEGEIGGIELIEARRTLIESRQSYADALYQYALTLAALERAVGAPIEGVVHEN